MAINEDRLDAFMGTASPATSTRCCTLAKGALQPIVDGRGTWVQCLEGALWLTQQGDARDIVLEAGDKAVIERNGTSIVFALGEVRFVLSDERALAEAMSRAHQTRAESAPTDAATAS